MRSKCRLEAGRHGGIHGFRIHLFRPAFAARRLMKNATRDNRAALAHKLRPTVDQTAYKKSASHLGT